MLYEKRKISGSDKTVAYVQIANELLVQFDEKLSDERSARLKEKFGISSFKPMMLENSYLLSFEDVSLEVKENRNRASRRS